MSIRTHCTKCRRVLNVPEDRVGRKVRCKCGNNILIENRPVRLPIPKGRELFEFLGRARLDNCKKLSGLRLTWKAAKRFLLCVFIYSTLVHVLLFTTIVLLLSVNFISMKLQAPAREDDNAIAFRFVRYDLVGQSSMKYAPEDLDDHEKGVSPESPGLKDELLTVKTTEAEIAADTSPDRLDIVDTTPSKPAEEKLAPASSPSEEREPAEKTEPAEETPEQIEHVEIPEQEPETAPDDLEPLKKKLERLVGYTENSPEKSKSNVTLVTSEEQTPAKARKASKPKNFNYTEWKKYLQARAVIGLEGAGGTRGAIDPGGGRPEFFGTPLSVSGKRAVFVLDYSPSMVLATTPFPDLDGTLVRGNKLDRAKTELKRAIASLKSDVAFTIIFFNQTYRTWKPILVTATGLNKDSAFAFVSRFQPTGGGTDVTSAMLAAFSLVGKTGSIVLLTDGAPNAFKSTANEQNAAEKAANRIQTANIHGIQIHAFGFFHEHEKKSGRRFLLRLAQDSDGSFVEVK